MEIKNDKKRLMLVFGVESSEYNITILFSFESSCCPNVIITAHLKGFADFKHINCSVLCIGL